MNRFHLFIRFLTTTALGLAVWVGTTGVLAAQQTAPTKGIPIHLVVTAEPHHGSSVPAITRDDVMVYEGHDRDTVTDWVPAQGDHAALELFVMIDDASTSRFGTQMDDIRKFINSQPPTTKIGIAYMQNGVAKIEQNLTSDHALAAKAIRLPMGIGGINASPYFSLDDLVNKWPAADARREVFMVTDGIDRYYGSFDLEDPYLAQAIDSADKAGIMVSAIYSPDTGHFGHSYWETYWGQIYLSEIAEKTGGEMYYFGFTGEPVAFAPYLDEFSQRLTHQYLLTFDAKVPQKAGWQQIRLRTEVGNVDLVAAKRVWVSPQH
jgi:hypothetical protein